MIKARCSLCGAPATICIKETINGVTTEKYYCDNCKGMIDSGAGLESLINSFFGMGHKPVRGVSKTCVCGTTEQEVINNGKFGCSECYKTFANIINEYIASRGYLTHKGKVPNTAIGGNNKEENKKSDTNIGNESDRLRAELQKAIDEQRFLDADKIAKQIKALERGDK